MMTMHRSSLLLVAVASTLVATLIATSASADDAASCIRSYEQTQQLRRGGKLREARAEAAKCANESCPAALSRDCGKWLGELDQSIPTVVFEVKSQAGEDLTSVKVSVDGKLLVEKLDGKSVTLDVGQHVFRFESTDGKGAPFEQKAVVVEGDKNKKIAVTLPSLTKPPPPGGPVVAPPQSERPIPVMDFVFGGVAIVSLGVGTFFAIHGSSQKSDLDACKPTCGADPVNKVSTSYAFADVLLTAGIVSAIAAIYIYVARPTVTATGTTTAALHGRFEF